MDSDFYRIFNKLLKLKIVNGFRISNGFRVQTDFGFRAEFLLRILTDFGFSKVKRILFLETFLNIALLFSQLCICKFSPSVQKISEIDHLYKVKC